MPEMPDASYDPIVSARDTVKSWLTENVVEPVERQWKKGEPFRVASGALMMGDPATAKKALEEAAQGMSRQDVEGAVLSAGVGMAPMGVAGVTEAAEGSALKDLLSKGGSIPAGKLFSGRPRDLFGPEFESNFTEFKRPKEVEVDPKSLSPTDMSVTTDGINRYMQGEGQLQGVPPEVYKSGDSYIIADGHHRAAAAIVAGADKIKVRVMGTENTPMGVAGVTEGVGKVAARDLVSDWASKAAPAPKFDAELQDMAAKSVEPKQIKSVGKNTGEFSMETPSIYNVAQRMPGKTAMQQAEAQEQQNVVMKSLKASGLRPHDMATLPKAVVARANLKPAAKLEPVHNIALSAVNEAVASLTGTEKLDAFRKFVGDNLTIGAAEYDPPHAAASMLRYDDKGVMLINTRHPVTEDYFDVHSSEFGSYSAIAAKKAYDAGAPFEDAMRLMYRGVALHELGHAMDAATGDLLTDMLMVRARENFKNPVEFQDYVARYISPYAAHSPKDATAEIFNVVMDGKPLPPKLRFMKGLIRGED